VSGKPDPQQFIKVDARQKVVALTLVAGYDGENNGFNFDGYGRGELIVTVPRRWRVIVRCRNRSIVRHSCAVVSGPMATRAAFRGASTPNPRLGLAKGAVATFSFRASRAGGFRLACLVPGHEDARMWDVLRIVDRGRPSIRARPGP
jgi:hypothetical protein